VTAKPAIDRETLRLIKQVILEEANKQGIKVEKIILFGSRARGDHGEDSDYDILVIVREGIDWRTKNKLYARIHRRLVRELRAPIDLLIVTAQWFYENASNKVTFEAEVAETGVELPM